MLRAQEKLSIDGVDAKFYLGSARSTRARGSHLKLDRMRMAEVANDMVVR